MDGISINRKRIPRPRIVASEMRGGSVCLIAVMKKHYSPLEKLTNWSDKVSDYYQGSRSTNSSNR